MSDQVSVEREIAAPPEQVWPLVAEVTRMGEWSPETVKCEWTGGSTGPEVGATFRGSNRVGRRRWSTTCTVAEAEPGKVFAFEVAAGPLKVARWEYRFEPTSTGCKVTETWTDHRGRFLKLTGTLASGVSDRATHNRAGMEQTLDRLAEAATS